MDKDTCLICHCPSEVGLQVFSAFLCPCCEKELVQTSPADPRYLMYVRQLRTALPRLDEVHQS